MAALIRIFIVGIMAAQVTQCTNESFTSKPTPTEKQPQPSTAIPDQSTNNPVTTPPTPQTPRNDTPIANMQADTSKQPIEQVSPNPNSLSQQQPQLNTVTANSLSFNAIIFSNMEQKRHSTDDGSYVVLRDVTTKQVVAAGPLTIEAAVNGNVLPSGQSAYPISKLTLKKLTHFDQEASAQGRGLLSVCRVTASEVQARTFSCSAAATEHDQARPVEWHNKSVQYNLSNGNISINNQPYGQGLSVTDGLSLVHPVSMGAIGGSVKQFADASSPLVLDLNGNRRLDLIDATDKKYNIKFKINPYGSPERVGWVLPEDGILALDINQDGLINDASELFGEFSAIRVGSTLRPGHKFANGFVALAQYDDQDDGFITASDTVFKQLRVWQDLNSDGISQPEELRTLVQLNISRINLKAEPTGEAHNYPLVAGNEVRFSSDFTTSTGRKLEIADVWFREIMTLTGTK